MEKYSFSLRITMFLACQLYVYNISGRNKRYEYDHVIHACDSLSFCGYILLLLPFLIKATCFLFLAKMINFLIYGAKIDIKIYRKILLCKRF